MRLFTASFASFVLGLPLVAACGEDATQGRPDATTDAATDTVFVPSDTGATTTEPTDTTATETADDTTATDTSEAETDATTTTTTTETDAATDTTEAETTDGSVATDADDTAAEVDDDTAGDTSEVIEPPPSGESCIDALVVTLPAVFDTSVTVSGDTGGLADDHDVAEGVCPGVDWELGLGSPDEVWAFTAPSAGSYAITLEAASADLALYVLKGCSAAGEGQCLRAADTIGGGPESPDALRVTLAAQEKVFVVVDAFAATPPEAGAYQLTFAPPQAAPLGDVCSAAITIQQGPGGFVGSGDNGPTSALSDDYDAGGCGAFFDGAGVPDQVWRFVAPTAGRWEIVLTPTGSADHMLYFFGDASCGGSCLGHVDDFAGGSSEGALADLAAGEELFIVVDSWMPEAGGQYLLAIRKGCTPQCSAGSCADDGCGDPCPCSADETCNPVTFECEVCEPSCAPGACGMDDGCGAICGCEVGEVCDPVGSACVTPTGGDTCDDAVALTAAGDGTLSGAGDLASGRGDDVATGTCPAVAGLPFDGVGTADETWTFQVPADGTYTVTVDSAADADVFFMLFTGPGCVDAACLGAADDALEGDSDAADFDLLAGVDYTLVVDTWSNTEAGAYTIDVREMVPPAPGDGCALPWALAPGPGGSFTGAGDLSLVDDADPDEFEVGGCADLGAAAFPPSGIDTPDEVFELNVPSDGTYTISVAGAEFVDVFLQLLEGPSCDDATCVGFKDDTFSGGTESVTLALDGQTTYWLVVDTYADFAGGAYTVEVTSACTPVCAPGSCGNDGCGDTCPCAAGEACGVGAQCAPIPGNACDDPFTLTVAGTTQTGAGDLGAPGVIDDFVLTGCADLGTSLPADGDGTVDEVFELTVPADGIYTIAVAPGASLDASWALLMGDQCASAACMGYLDEVELGGAEAVDVALQAANTYWLVVDMYALTTPGPYGVTVTQVSTSVPGEACESPFTLTLGVATSGTTLAAADDLDGLACAGGGVGGAGQGDLVYFVNLPLAGDYAVTLTPAGGADLALYALDTAAGTCNEGVCLVGANAAGANGVEAITLSAAADDDAAYVVVDGATAAGAFTIDTSTSIVGCATDLFFSEYIEGSGFTKGLEIFNGTGAAVDLSGYTVRVRQNGGSSAGTSGSYIDKVLSGSLAAGATYTLCHSSFAGKDCDFESPASVVNFNGNDAIMLLKGAVVIDRIGLDDQPTTGPWAVGSGSTIDTTLVRKAHVRSGAVDWLVGVDQWLVFGSNTSDDFDAHDYFWQCP